MGAPKGKKAGAVDFGENGIDLKVGACPHIVGVVRKGGDNGDGIGKGRAREFRRVGGRAGIGRSFSAVAETFRHLYESKKKMSSNEIISISNYFQFSKG